jgi:hypothetical protein
MVCRFSNPADGLVDKAAGRPLKKGFALSLILGCFGACLRAHEPRCDKVQATPGTTSAPAAAPAKAETAPAGPSQASRKIPVVGDPLFAPLATSQRPETFREKFRDYQIRIFEPRALAGPAFTAAYQMARPPRGYPREWRDGSGAFARLYGGGLARGTSVQTGRFLAGALLHEDFRYRPSSGRNFVVRSLHALAFTFWDRSDSGSGRVALANFVGAAAGGFVGEIYLPAGYKDHRHSGMRAAVSFGGLAAQNWLREFAPDMRSAARKLHLPFPRIPAPGSWEDGNTRRAAALAPCPKPGD